MLATEPALIRFEGARGTSVMLRIDRVASTVRDMVAEQGCETVYLVYSDGSEGDHRACSLSRRYS